MQAASVAVDGRSITSYADQMKLKCLHAVAPLWTDGNLGDNNGLPERKTRIYIPEDMALPGRSVRVADCAREASNNGTAPAKKKRKGKAERNRLKREHEQALASNTAAMTSQ